MSKEESLKLKGLAIILMFIHHFIGCVGMIKPENQCNLIFGTSTIHMAVGCVICIPLFSFVSGYGMHKSYFNSAGFSTIIKRLFKFLITYWTMLFLVAIPYLVYTDKFNIAWLPMNLFALLHNDDMLYLSFSWYVKLYIEFLLVIPIVKKSSEKINNILIESMFFIILPVILAYFIPDSEEKYSGILINILSSIKLICGMYPVFHIGILFSKYNLLDDKFYKTKCNRIIVFLISCIGFAVSIAFQYIWYSRPYTTVVVLIIFVLSYKFLTANINLKYISKILSFLGKYSFQYWLLSGMFYLNTVELQKYLFFPKNPILVVLWGFLILTPFAIIMNKISSFVIKKSFTLITLLRKKRDC